MQQPFSYNKDAKIYSEFKKLPVFPFYRLIRPDKESADKSWNEFISTKKLPVFQFTKAKEYPIKKYLSALNNFEKKITSFVDNELIAHIYREKCEELRLRAQLIIAIQKENDLEVSKISKQLFGTPESIEKHDAEFSEMKNNSHTFHKHKKIINAEIFKKMVKRLLARYQMKHWKVRIKDTSSVRINHGSTVSMPAITIPSALLISKARAARLLTHEIEVHALRTENGRNSGITLLGKSLANYLKTEEGLAIYYQTQVATEHKKFIPGFWDSYANVLGTKMALSDVFQNLFNTRYEILKKINKDTAKQEAQDCALRLCKRLYRGITNPNKAGLGFFRDHIYRTGYNEVSEAIKNNPDILTGLFHGNFSLKDFDKIQDLITQEPKMPMFLGKEIVNSTIEQQTSLEE